MNTTEPTTTNALQQAAERLALEIYLHIAPPMDPQWLAVRARLAEIAVRHLAPVLTAKEKECADLREDIIEQANGYAATIADLRAEVAEWKAAHAAEMSKRIDSDAAIADLRAALARLQTELDFSRAEVERLQKRGTSWEAIDLRAQLADALKDKERLDWLEAEGHDVLCARARREDTDQRHAFWVRGHLDGETRTLRASIDNARAK